MATTTIEKRLEADFAKWCRSLDIVPIKGPANTVKGFPDKFVQLPKGGGTIYAEFKGTSYYTLTPIQEWWKNYLMNSNPNRYFLIETKEELELLKIRCQQFILIGPELVEYEKRALAFLGNNTEI